MSSKKPSFEPSKTTPSAGLPRRPAASSRFARWLGVLILLAAAGWVCGWWVARMTPPEPESASSSTPSWALAAKRKVVAPTDNPADASAEQVVDPAVAAKAAEIAKKAFDAGAYRKGELILRAGSADEFAALLKRAQAAGATIIGTIGGLNAARISFPDAQSMANFLKSGGLADESLQPEYNITLTLPTPPPPTDPYAPGSLQPFGNSALAYMGVPQNNANWGKGVMLAMLDTGLSPGTTNLLKGGTISQMDLTGANDMPPAGHGDMVAALLAGATGQQGIVPGASILSVRVLDSNNQGDVFAVSDGIYSAIAQGAKVLSLSLGSNQSSALLQQAVNYAISQGVVVVAAAGNDGVGQISYPAAYPGVVAVGAVDATGTRATFSDYGPQMGLTAPGVGLNTVTPSGIQSFSGTSAAAPLVAGAVASLLSTNPGMTGQQAVDLLTQYADYAGPVTGTGTNDFYGSGRIDLARVLNRANTTYTDGAIADMYLNVTSMPSTPTAPLQIIFQNRGNTILPYVQVDVDFNGLVTSQTLTVVKPNEVRAVTVELPVAQLLSPSGILVTASANGRVDAIAKNNVMARIVRLVSTKSSGN